MISDAAFSASPTGQRPRALVTGGSSGIGLAFARQLAARGYALVLVARGKERLNAVAEQFRAGGVECETMCCDLGVGNDVARLCSYLDDHAVDVVVNNAGAGLYESLVNGDMDRIEAAAALMAGAPVRIGAAATAAMAARGKGTLINIASVQSFVPMGAYAALKSFVRVWSESLAVELHGSGVTVTAVLPGWVRSDFHRNSGGKRSGVPDALWLEPDTVARAALAAAARGKVRCTPTVRYKIIGFLAEKGPRCAVNWVARKINGSGRKADRG
ncbi:SDR family NAD(P)-dependent oxidoreductase [Actinotignum schaalii]|uniref:SDR family NAD(P)-dependent oxidoreductase n=1 Tax=Actinomycetaceae TaxID=2049 RepID=UPI00237E5867|nr:SDR family NAD(P)-dependent oxidoreductase [Actinotignum schaalii]MDE1655435.1 SDR family NAD(P)-dependent oxidoreductase [Actinotignum schaalii]MDK6787713.1 SDR family NAD(P)-dependent oxidoreductase [Actinotignum timonense]